MCFLDVKVQFLFFPEIHSNSEWKGVNQNWHWKSMKMNTRGSENEDAEFSLPLKGSLFWACHPLHLLQEQHFPRLLWLHTDNFWALILPHRNGIYLIFDFNYWCDKCLNLVYLAAEIDLGEIHLHPSSTGWKVEGWQMDSTLDPFFSRVSGKNKPRYNGFWLQPQECRDYWD